MTNYTMQPCLSTIPMLQYKSSIPARNSPAASNTAPAERMRRENVCQAGLVPQSVMVEGVCTESAEENRLQSNPSEEF